MFDRNDLPQRARPAVVAWQAGGKQEFPTDPKLDAYRHQQLKDAGKIIIRRRPRQ